MDRKLLLPYAHAQLQPGGMIAEGCRDRAMGSSDHKQEAIAKIQTKLDCSSGWSPHQGEDGVFSSITPRGLSAPACGSAAPPGLVFLVNTPMR
jgi:hypothetical protein